VLIELEDGLVRLDLDSVALAHHIYEDELGDLRVPRVPLFLVFKRG
jgi:hypothetical protein